MTATVIVTPHGEVESGFAIPSDELTELRNFLHSDLAICEDSLRVPAAGDAARQATTAGGRSYSIGDDWAPEQCEFCTHYAARILAKYELQERG